METSEKKKGSMDMQAMMEAYAKFGRPGAQHKMLESMAGSWETKVKTWPEPGMPPMESTGSSQAKMIMGGRFLQEEFKGEMMGTPFGGLGITGYDNHSKKFESIWLDSSSTSILLFMGPASQDNKTIIMDCSHDDAVRGPMKWRSITRFIDANKHIFEMYNTVQSGKEVKSMEITYTRRI